MPGGSVFAGTVAVASPAAEVTPLHEYPPTTKSTVAPATAAPPGAVPAVSFALSVTGLPRAFVVSPV